MTFFKSTTALCAALLVAGCGGGGDNEAFVFSPATGATSGKVYYALDSQVAATSQLGGISLVVNETDNTIELREADGTLVHATGEVTINNGVISFSDPNGADGNDRLTDGVVTAEYYQVGDFLSLMDLEFTSGGDDYYVMTVGGIVTQPEDFPRNRSRSNDLAIYVGSSAGVVLTDSETTRIQGDARGQVIFAAGSVNLTMDNFTATTLNGSPTTTQVGSIQTVMWFNGTSFESDNVGIRGTDGSLINPTGSNTTDHALSNLYGLNATGTPDELGGIVLIEGDDGIIFADFIGQHRY